MAWNAKLIATAPTGYVAELEMGVVMTLGLVGVPLLNIQCLFCRVPDLMWMSEFER